MERGRSFEADRPRIETPEQNFREDIRNEALNVLRNSENPLAIEIAEKALAKISIKDRMDKLARYRDDTTVYQEWKQLGLFLVIDKTSQIDWSDSESGVKIQKGDRVLDIHLPPVPPEQRALAKITASMQLIAEYITRQGLDVKHVVGVTSERLAAVSSRQGFTVIEPEIPEDIKRGVENVYRRFSESDNPIGRILLCYQSKEQFLQRYSKPLK